MMYEVVLSDRAKRTYESSPIALRKKIDRAIDQIASDPRQHPNIKSLKGPLAGYWRFRVGDHRIVYRIEDDNRIVIVLLIAHRKDVYE